ncbi:MAG: diadenylate cyclase CdaA [candidate division KSB1 bacterium]|nr:diadenylate cyclase CdaA [candidate division KSB1 bacterium]
MVLFRIAFLRFTIIDLLDVLAITYILCQLYYFVRGSRAAQMTVGFVLLLMASVIAPLLNMSGLTWILRNLSTVWLLAFVVLFQPELRRLLIRLGQSQIIRLFVRVHENRTVEEVAKAAFELSKRGLGALIVLARDMGLKAIIETGVPIRAEVSVPLLVSIFNLRSPLHDGAVVIQNDILEAAKCLLPLSQSPDLDPSLGTRHRAALGLSEESDAVVVIVSEETGAVSVAVNGELIRNFNYENLRRFLNEALRIAEPAPRPSARLEV